MPVVVLLVSILLCTVSLNVLKGALLNKMYYYCVFPVQVGFFTAWGVCLRSLSG